MCWRGQHRLVEYSSKEDSQRDFSLYFGVSPLQENLFIVDIHIKVISLVGKTPSCYCGTSLPWNFVKRRWTVSYFECYHNYIFEYIIHKTFLRNSHCNFTGIKRIII